MIVFPFVFLISQLHLAKAFKYFVNWTINQTDELRKQSRFYVFFVEHVQAPCEGWNGLVKVQISCELESWQVSFLIEEKMSFFIHFERRESVSSLQKSMNRARAKGRGIFQYFLISLSQTVGGKTAKKDSELFCEIYRQRNFRFFPPLCYCLVLAFIYSHPRNRLQTFERKRAKGNKLKLIRFAVSWEKVFSVFFSLHLSVIIGSQLCIIIILCDVVIIATRWKNLLT